MKLCIGLTPTYFRWSTRSLHHGRSSTARNRKNTISALIQRLSVNHHATFPKGRSSTAWSRKYQYTAQNSLSTTIISNWNNTTVQNTKKMVNILIIKNPKLNDLSFLPSRVLSNAPVIDNYLKDTGDRAQGCDRFSRSRFCCRTVRLPISNRVFPENVAESHPKI